MPKLIKLFCLLTLIIGILSQSDVAEAHGLKSDNGYTAVIHIDPDDDPEAGQPTVLNFLIGKDGASYNQNDYNISVDISANGKQLKHIKVEPEVFGNAGDGVAKYTFPSANAYTIVLRGSLKTDSSTRFQMIFPVQVSHALGGTALAASKKNSPTVILLSAGSLLMLGLVGFIVISGGKRYAKKSPSKL